MSYSVVCTPTVVSSMYAINFEWIEMFEAHFLTAKGGLKNSQNPTIIVGTEPA